MSEVGEQIQVSAAQGRVLVHITLENSGAGTVYVPKAIAGAEQLSSRLFQIVEAGSGAPVDYVGKMLKRGPLTAADYVTLAPHASLRHSIDIGASYAFVPGTHSYRLSHDGSYLTDLARLDAATPLAPASAQFSFTR